MVSIHRPSAVHLLAHDGFYLVNHAQAHGHVGIDPSASFLIIPARVMSWWLTTSASAGLLQVVEMKNWEAFIGLAIGLEVHPLAAHHAHRA